MSTTAPEECCAYCGWDWIVDGLTVYGCDIRHDADEQFLTWQPCCEGHLFDVQMYGFEATLGLSVLDVVRMIAPGLDAIDITEPGDSCIIARLVVDNPTEVKPGGKAKAPKGWQAEVFAEVEEHHRHHEAPQGHKFSIAVRNGYARVGVAVISNPVSRKLREAHPNALEVTRVATWGRSELRKNASSKLYGEAGRQARQLGADLLITYTLLDEEDGASLIAAGFTPTRISRGGRWSRKGRARKDTAPTGRKVRWERGLTRRARKDVAARAIAV